MADAQVALAGAFRSANKNHTDDDVMDYDAIGDNPQIYHTRTHLGAILQPGDTVMGYHLTTSNYNSDDFVKLNSSHVPDIILVKKAYPNRRKKSKVRVWKLRSIAKEAGEEGETGNSRGIVGRLGGRDQKKVEEDYELFLRDIEEDPETRASVNLYKAQDVTMAPPAKGKKKVQYGMDVDGAEPEVVAKTIVDEEGGVEEEVDFPEVSLDDLLEDFDEMTLGTHSEEPESAQ